MRRALLALALLAPAAHAFEAPTTFGVHMASVHDSSGRNFVGPRGWNNTNPGVYARWSNGFTAGAYRNSYYHLSTYAGVTFTDDQDRFALTVGGITGYPRLPVLPLVVPSVRVPLNDRASLRLSFAAGGIKGANALHLSMEGRF